MGPLLFPSRNLQRRCWKVKFVNIQPTSQETDAPSLSHSTPTPSPITTMLLKGQQSQRASPSSGTFSDQWVCLVKGRRVKGLLLPLTLWDLIRTEKKGLEVQRKVGSFHIFWASYFWKTLITYISYMVALQVTPFKIMFTNLTNTHYTPLFFYHRLSGSLSVCVVMNKHREINLCKHKVVISAGLNV